MEPEFFVIKPLGRPVYKYEDNNKMELREIGHDYVYGIHVAED
jgi:hypothetical protein